MIRHIDYIEFYVSNAFETAKFYQEKFGFNIIAFGDQSTGLKEKTSFILKQNEAILIFTSSTNPLSPVATHVKKHGNSIKDIALRVDDIENLSNHLKKTNAPIEKPLEKVFHHNQTLTRMSLCTFGDVIHTLIERDNNSFILPFYKSLQILNKTAPRIFKTIDHVAIALETNSLEKWVQYYKTFFNFKVTHKEDVYTGKSGMESMVVSSQNNQIKFPLVSPMKKSPKGQIDTFLEQHQGPGVQHLAFLTDDIIQSVKKIKESRIEFLDVPVAYYEKLKEASLNHILKKNLGHIMNLNILLDSEKNSTLLQTFTKPLTQKPPFFIEVIERHQHTGFGSKNIKALFEAVERSQVK